MNIFVLDTNPFEAARHHCDKHVVKMITETSQLLSTCLRLQGRDDPLLYKVTHVNHPCSVWLRENRANFTWLMYLMNALLNEYDRRYGMADKFSAARAILRYCQESVEISEIGMTPFVLCMPDQYKVEGDPVASYRNYYRGDKAGFATWRSGAPDWWATT